MKITIVGAGAIGGLAGAWMTEAGHDLQLVDRWVEHVDAMNAKGLTVDGVRGDRHFEVKATIPDRLTGPLEAVLVATKSRHTLDAIRQLVPLFGPETFVVSFQNGFNEPDIVALLDEHGLDGSSRVLGSIPNDGGALVDPGHIEFVHEGPIPLGEMDGRTAPRLTAPTDRLSALTNIQLSGNIWAQIWAKEVYSAQVIVSALVDARIHETLGIERHARISGAIVKEALEIADANGITVEPFDVFHPADHRVKTAEDTKTLLANVNHAIWLLKKDQKPGGHDFKKKGSGIWWDVVYRKRLSEVRSSNGKLPDYGRKAGADVRLNEKLHSMIHEIEAGQRQLGFHNHDELEATVNAIGKALA